MILAAALAVRLALLLVTEGYATDVSCFFGLGVPPGGWGAGAVFCGRTILPITRPPICWCCGLRARRRGCWGSLMSEQGALPWYWGRAHFVRSGAGGAGVADRRRFGGAACCGWRPLPPFLPAPLYDTGVWKQVDGVFALALVGAVLAAARKKYLPAAAAYGLALWRSPRRCCLARCWRCAFGAAFDRAAAAGALRVLGRTALGAGFPVAVVWLCSLPFQARSLAGLAAENTPAR